MDGIIQSMIVLIGWIDSVVMMIEKGLRLISRVLLPRFGGLCAFDLPLPLLFLRVSLQGEALEKYLKYLEVQNVLGLDLEDLSSAIRLYRKNATKLEDDGRDPLENDISLCNEKIVLVERNFLLEEGLLSVSLFLAVSARSLSD
jgi:hypothetical protein